MNTDDYEQITLQKDFIENSHFLKEGETVEVLFHADQGMPLSASLLTYNSRNSTYRARCKRKYSN